MLEKTSIASVRGDFQLDAVVSLHSCAILWLEVSVARKLPASRDVLCCPAVLLGATYDSHREYGRSISRTGEITSSWLRVALSFPLAPVRAVGLAKAQLVLGDVLYQVDEPLRRYHSTGSLKKGKAMAAASCRIDVNTEFGL